MDYEHLFPKIVDYLRKIAFEHKAEFCFHNDEHTKDVYSQGEVLGRKYQSLQSNYAIFMDGLILSVAAFCIAVLFAK